MTQYSDEQDEKIKARAKDVPKEKLNTMKSAMAVAGIYDKYAELEGQSSE